MNRTFKLASEKHFKYLASVLIVPIVVVVILSRDHRENVNSSITLHPWLTGVAVLLLLISAAVLLLEACFVRVIASSEGVTVFVEALAKEQGISKAEFEKEFFRNVRPSSLLKRFIQPEEIAATVAFLCSPAASAINGAAVRVDGGVVKSAF